MPYPYPVVPETITVHLGAPGESARNVVVPFAQYIKNVASHEIYPTWPESAILISHGGAFNWHRPDHFRVVYLPRMGMLRETMGEISDFFSYYWQS